MTDAQTGAPTVGVVAESGSDERRVALVPKAVSALVNMGVSVVVESGAGDRALLPDSSTPMPARASATPGPPASWSRSRLRHPPKWPGCAAARR